MKINIEPKKFPSRVRSWKCEKEKISKTLLREKISSPLESEF